MRLEDLPRPGDRRAQGGGRRRPLDTVRVRTTIGQLFKSGSGQLDAGQADLFDRIGQAIETEQGPVKVEGYSDSDKIAALAFPDNTALSKARAEHGGGAAQEAPDRRIAGQRRRLRRRLAHRIEMRPPPARRPEPARRSRAAAQGTPSEDHGGAQEGLRNWWVLSVLPPCSPCSLFVVLAAARGRAASAAVGAADVPGPRDPARSGACSRPGASLGPRRASKIAGGGPRLAAEPAAARGLSSRQAHAARPWPGSRRPAAASATISTAAPGTSSSGRRARARPPPCSIPGCAFPFTDTALKGVGGTRNLDFWFADEAVLVDTAGRYTTQDSDADRDKGAWNAFLAAAPQEPAAAADQRRHRRHRPGRADRRRRRQDRPPRRHRPPPADRAADGLRDRRAGLCPLHQGRPPGAGFAEFYDDLDVEGRRAVLGSTFPWRETHPPRSGRHGRRLSTR